MEPVIGQSTPSGFDPGGGEPIKFGVWGDSGDGDGVIGSSARPGATGPAGATPGGAGVLGLNNEFQGVGVQGRANADTGTAVLGQSEQGTGVAGRSKGSNPGVVGASVAGAGVSGTSDQGAGVAGRSTGSSPGVAGTSVAGPGVSGTSDQGAGVSGAASGFVHAGVEGTNDQGTGVLGTSRDGVGISARCGHPEGPDGIAVGGGFGFAAGFAPAVMGVAFDGAGVMGFSFRGVGVEASGRLGIVASAAEPPDRFHKDRGMAGVFRGNVNVTGTLFKGGVAFRIDHPLDPENRYLAHSSVESPEMKNLYDGVVTLDDDGQATVELPAWFEALNETFRYQLTAIGAPGPNLHVSRRLADNRFTIAGGDPRMEVCWQVTGVRRDAWALAHPLVVEEDKAPQERGYYLHPDEHGQSADRDLFSVQYAGSSRLPDRPDEA